MSSQPARRTASTGSGTRIRTRHKAGQPGARYVSMGHTNNLQVESLKNKVKIIRAKGKYQSAMKRTSTESKLEDAYKHRSGNYCRAFIILEIALRT